MITALGPPWPFAEGYEINTHRAISEKAVEGSSLAGALMGSLNFERGIDQVFRGRRVEERYRTPLER
jgi:hypothetical protein